MQAAPRCIVKPYNFPTKKRFRTKHLVTLFYSSIISTAAWADSAAKRRRRQKLDAAIAQAQDDLRNSEPDRRERSTRSIHTKSGMQASVTSTTASVDEDNDFMLLAMQRASSKTSTTISLIDSDKLKSDTPSFMSENERRLLPKLSSFQDNGIDTSDGHTVSARSNPGGCSFLTDIRKRPLQTSNNAKSYPSVHNGHESVFNSLRTASSPVEIGDIRNTNFQSNYHSPSEVLSRLKHDRKLTFDRRNSDHTLPESIYRIPIATRKKKNFPWMQKKITKFELNMASLALSLLLEASELSTVDSDLSQNELNPERLKSALQDLDDKLQDAKNLPADHHFPIDTLKYPKFDAETLNSPKLHLHESSLNLVLILIFENLVENRISLRQALQLVARNLLVSKVAPDTKTMGILITKFSAIGKHELAQLTVDLLPKLPLRQSEITVCAVLCHYIKVRDKRNFVFYSRMVNPRLKEDSNIINGPYRLVKHAVPRVKPDKHVYFELLRGNMKFGRLSEVLQILDDMRESGSAPDIVHYRMIIRICARRSQQLLGSTGYRLNNTWLQEAKRYLLIGCEAWKGTMALCSHNMNCMAGIIDVSMVSQFLYLCKTHGKNVLFNKIYRDALCAGYPMHSLLILNPSSGYDYWGGCSTETIQRRRRRLEISCLAMDRTIRLSILQLTTSLVILRPYDKELMQDLSMQLNSDEQTVKGDSIRARGNEEARFEPSAYPCLFRVDFR